MNKELVDKLIGLTVDQYIKEPEKLKQEIISIVDSLIGQNVLSTIPNYRIFKSVDVQPLSTDPFIEPYKITCGVQNENK